MDDHNDMSHDINENNCHSVWQKDNSTLWCVYQLNHIPNYKCLYHIKYKDLLSY